MKQLPVLYIVIPCYNEQEVLPHTVGMFKNKLLELINKEKISNESRILFVNDGSKDTTWDLIKEYADDVYIEGISQSRNRGHQNAVLAGLMVAKNYADITISIDCDGQDDINAMDEMVDNYHQGYEVVYGVRSARKTDTFFKRFTAESFYKLLKGLGVEVVYNHADYRLLSKKVLDAFSEYQEVNLFLRGIIPLVGFKSSTVSYEREERIAGESHYPLKKMLSLALDGITSLPIKPLRVISSIGFITSFISFVAIIWTLINYLLFKTVSGWASTVILIAFMGGIQLLSIGIIGEYIGKIYMETKRRPRYIISESTIDKDINSSVDNV